MASPHRSSNHLGSWLTAGLVGAIVLLLAALLSPPAMVPFPGHGEDFAAHTNDPLSLTGAFPQRLLWPLLAWLVGLGGESAPWFSQVCSGALLAVVFWFCRQRGAQPVDALLVTLAVGATGAVQLYQTMTCHSDSLNWILLLLMVHHVQRRFVFWALVLLCALSHEMIFFFAPWLVYARWWQSRTLGRELAGLAVVVGSYQLWRMLVKSIGSVQGYDIAYYIDNHWLVWGTLGLWLLWSMLLLVEFGPLLAIVVWSWRSGRLGVVLGGGKAGPWLYLACVLSLMAFAYDVQRFASYAFLPLVLGSIQFLACGGTRGFYLALLVLGIGTYTALHWVPGQAGGWPYERTAALILELGTHAPGTRHRFFTELLPRVWPAALAFAGGGLMIVAVGCWLVRRVPPGLAAAHPDGTEAGSARRT